MVVVADGSARADRCLARVLRCDPGMGILRHADAGYDEAIDAADRLGVRIPRRDREGL
jgi:urocanate hydratase